MNRHLTPFIPHRASLLCRAYSGPLGPGIAALAYLVRNGQRPGVFQDIVHTEESYAHPGVGDACR